MALCALSVVMAVVSVALTRAQRGAALALVLGIVALLTAYLLTRRRGPLARILAMLTEVPYALPGIVIRGPQNVQMKEAAE